MKSSTGLGCQCNAVIYQNRHRTWTSSHQNRQHCHGCTVHTTSSPPKAPALHRTGTIDSAESSLFHLVCHCAYTAVEPDTAPIPAVFAAAPPVEPAAGALIAAASAAAPPVTLSPAAAVAGPSTARRGSCSRSAWPGKASSSSTSASFSMPARKPSQ